MEEILRTNLIDLGKRFNAATGMSLPMIGLRALNDTSFYKRITHGGGFTVRTYDRVISWLSTEWPRETEWPSGIERLTQPTEISGQPKDMALQEAAKL
jgi:hypothetical protein